MVWFSIAVVGASDMLFIRLHSGVWQWQQKVVLIGMHNHINQPDTKFNPKPFLNRLQ